MMRSMVIVLALIGMSGSLSGEEWYQGGTLHKADAREWHQASSRNQLATSADFVAAAKAAKSMEQLRIRATAVKSCITAATDDPKLHSQKVSVVAAACMIQLGYK